MNKYLPNCYLMMFAASLLALYAGARTVDDTGTFDPVTCNNCAEASNPDQLDIDRGGIGDVGDPEIPDDLNFALSLQGGDGNSSHIDLSGFPLTTLPFTIEMWIKPDGTQAANSGLMYHRGTADAGLQYSSDWQGAQRLRMMYQNPSGNFGVVTDVVSAGEWHHVAMVVTATSRTVYLDGTPYAEDMSLTAYDFSAGNLYIGWDAAAGNRAFKGLIDEVRIWSEAKTAEALQSGKYNIVDAANASGLLGYWNFDDKAPGVATDLSASGFDGTITGGSYTPSTLLDPMEYVRSDAAQKAGLVNDHSADNVLMVLEIETKNENDPLHLTELDLSAGGTTALSEMTNVKVYATGSDSVFSSSGLIAESAGTPASEDFTLNADHALAKGKNYIWITCDIADGAAAGNTFDLVCNGFSLTSGAGADEYVPATSDPAGSLTVDPAAFMDHTVLDADTVTYTAHSSIEGSNFASFQQNAIMTYNGYQYVTFWNTVSRVCIARKALPDGNWEVLELTDHTVDPGRVNDNHYTISMGICENDGTIHLAYDHHNDILHYQRSVTGLANDPAGIAWSNDSFGPKQDYLVSGTQVSNVTYPRFLSKPDGDLIFETRIGWSGDGDSFLWEYSGETGMWEYIGEYLNGTSVGENAYINGIHYDQDGRLHVSWVWRGTPDPQTNHDVYYGYSDDDGRTWFNSAGEEVAIVNDNPMSLNTPGLKVWPVGQNRGLINQEAQAVDSKGRIHILQSYIGEDHPNSNNFWEFRINYGDLRHIYQDESGTWQSDVIAPSGRNRSEIAVDRNDNLYVVTGDHRIYYAAAASNWQTWTEFDISRTGLSINEGFVDRERLLIENMLSYVFAHSDNDGKILVSNYRLASDDARLSDLTVDGTTVSGFDPAVTEYEVTLPAGTTEVPVVEGVPTDAGASVEIDDTPGLPGTTTITVTAENGTTTQVYTVSFAVLALGVGSGAQLNLFPNPVADVVRIESPHEISRVEMYNLGGRLLKAIESIGHREVDVPVKMLPQGTYVLKAIHSDHRAISRKMVKE